MSKNTISVAEKRKYGVLDVKAAKKIAFFWLEKIQLTNVVDFGLPEVDDRYHIWRVPLIHKFTKERLGEVVVDARTSLILQDKSTSVKILEARLLGRNATALEDEKDQNSDLDDDEYEFDEEPQKTKQHSIIKDKSRNKREYYISNLRNTIAYGDCAEILQELPAESVNLVFTSPPYFNARPEYNDYLTYEEYLLKMRKVIHNVHRVLSEGRFFVINVAPVLIRRSNRNESSKRIAVPFDLHRIFMEEGYDFIDDIIWEKPEGAGWATGRGRRFAADRNPLQYKAVPVTEYILVYRKKSSHLIDWNIRNHPKQELVASSRVGDDYERTNIWKITPTHDKRHPAVFPTELADKVITYYSFKEDVVLDPFAGIGTVGASAIKLGRRFALIEQDDNYISIIRQEAKKWLGKDAHTVFTINCSPLKSDDTLF